MSTLYIFFDAYPTTRCTKGLFQKKVNGEWEIRICCSRYGDNIKVSIFDNGPGFDAKALKESKGIGMANIRKRLMLQYGKEDLMQVKSESGEYADVCILFPMEGKNEVLDNRG